jgi:hypothetical protein
LLIGLDYPSVAMRQADTANGDNGDVQHSLLASEAGTGRSDANFQASKTAGGWNSSTIPFNRILSQQELVSYIASSKASSMARFAGHFS